MRFLSPAAFEKTLVGDQDELSKDDKAELEHVTGLLRALGLLTGDVDLQKAVSGFQGGAVLAYYSFDDERITVRGKKITPSIKATLVHELTHVLQDQEFQIGDRLKALRKESEKGRSTNAASVLGAIVEGDAERVRYLYQASLTPKQRQVAHPGAGPRVGRRAAADRGHPAAGGHPALVAVRPRPRPGGGPGRRRRQRLGRQAVREAAGPRRGTVRPVPGGRAEPTAPTKVAVPALESGEKEFESGELGTLTWYFMLAAHLPLTQALLAADGWGGDAYVGYDRGDTTCAKLSFTGRSPGDTALMETALRQWAAAAPGEQTVTSEGKLVDVASCDPGTGVSGRGRHLLGRDDAAVGPELVDGRVHPGPAAGRGRALHGEPARRHLLGRPAERPGLRHRRRRGPGAGPADRRGLPLAGGPPAEEALLGGVQLRQLRHERVVRRPVARVGPERLVGGHQ